MSEPLLAVISALCQVSTPVPDTGPEELVVYWPVIVRIGWFLVGVIAVILLGRLFVEPLLIRLVRRRNRNNPTLQAAITLYFRLVVVLFAVLVGAAVAGYGAFLGDSALVLSALALAVGIAAQEVIGSLVSGIALVTDPEFNVGDYIEWESGEGVVKSIALRVTRVETNDGELVTIPNTILTSHEIRRPYGRAKHRIVHEFGIDYDDDPSLALTHLKTVATETDGILAEPPPATYLDELDDDEVTLRVHYWINAPHRRDVFEIRSAYALAAKARLENEGFTVSPPAGRELDGRLDIGGVSREL